MNIQQVSANDFLAWEGRSSRFNGGELEYYLDLDARQSGGVIDIPESGPLAAETMRRLSQHGGSPRLYRLTFLRKDPSVHSRYPPRIEVQSWGAGLQQAQARLFYAFDGVPREGM